MIVIAGGPYSNTIEVLDPSEAQWNLIGVTLPSALYHQTGVTVGHDFLVVGGSTGGSSGYRSEMYHLSLVNGTYGREDFPARLSIARARSVAMPLPAHFASNCN